MKIKTFFNQTTINNSMIIVIVGYFLIELFHFNNPLYSFNNFYEKLQMADYFYLIVLFLFLIKFIISNHKKAFLNLDTYEILPLLFLFFCIITSIFSENGLQVSQFLKYGYLISIFYIVRNIAVEGNNIKILVICMLNILIIYFFILLLSYFTAVITKTPNFFVLFYEGYKFPYIEELYRLKGGYNPTAKLLALHLFLALVSMYLFKDYLSEKKKFILLFLIFILAFLTFSRAGLIVCLLSIYIFLRLADSRYLVYCYVPILIFTIFSFEIFSLIFIESNNFNFLCEQNFQPKEFKQRFGWFGQELQCNLNLSVNIFQDGYLILKLVGINAGLENFLVGNGIGSYAQIWVSAANNHLIPIEFLDYVFPLAQSTPVTLFAENGIIGVLIYMLFLFGSFSRRSNIFKNLDTFIICFSIFFVALNLDIQNFRFLYFYLGIFYAYHYLEQKKKYNEAVTKTI